MLFAGLTIGLVTGLIILGIDHCRKRRSKVLYIKDSITLEYDCTPPGIYQKIRTIFED
jgi:hypothetical protein